MKKGALSSDVLLLLTAAIWGFAFTAQRAGMDHIGPFLYNGIRFLLGALVLVPFLISKKTPEAAGTISEHKPERALPAGAEGSHDSPARTQADADDKTGVVPLLKGGILAGVFLFFGVSFQQIGLLYTTAGKAGFITGLYVILVPILGIFWKHRSHRGTWAGAGLAVAGLYLLSVTGGFRISAGDLLVLGSAFFWAFHVHIIGILSKSRNAVKLAVVQYVFCGIVSCVVAVGLEPIQLSAIWDAALPIAYGGICSVGIAYTLQIVAQKSAPPAHAAIIMSLEGVFAVAGGYLILGEMLSAKGFLGCGLMLCGMIISQISVSRSATQAPL